jgi:hypothetical protein
MFAKARHDEEHPLTRLPSIARATAVALALLSLAHAASALDEGRTEQGLPYVSGGISLDERHALQPQRGSHSLWAEVAVAGSSAFRGNVHLRIQDAGGRTLFDRDLDGPWLFIDLPPGRYSISAVAPGGTQQRRVDIRAGDHQQVVMRLPAGNGS